MRRDRLRAIHEHGLHLVDPGLGGGQGQGEVHEGVELAGGGLAVWAHQR